MFRVTGRKVKGDNWGPRAGWHLTQHRGLDSPLCPGAAVLPSAWPSFPRISESELVWGSLSYWIYGTCVSLPHAKCLTG